MRSNLTIGTKLMAGTAATFVLTLILSYSGLAAMGKFKEQFDTGVAVMLQKVVLCDKLVMANAEMASAQRGLILAAYAKDAAETEKYRQMFRQNTEILQTTLDEVRERMVREEAKAWAAAVAANLSAWQPHFEDIVKRCAAGDVAEANRIRKEITGPIYNNIDTNGRRLVAGATELLAVNRAVLADQYSRGRWIAFSLLGLSLVVGGAVVWVVRQVSGTLRQIAGEMSEGAEQVASAATQVSSSSQSLSQGASEQAASIEETSASAEEIHSMTRKNAENSKAAADNMVDAPSALAKPTGTWSRWWCQ